MCIRDRQPEDDADKAVDIESRIRQALFLELKRYLKAASLAN